MILMPQIFDVTANENTRYKRNELEYDFLNIAQIKEKIIVLWSKKDRNRRAQRRVTRRIDRMILI